jgi:uridine kinase
MNSTYLIGIAGPSCAGKTELARYLSRLLDAPVLSLDSYYHDLGELPFDQRGQRNFDAPQSLDHELLIAQLQGYVAGRPLQHPVYDFKTHSRTGHTETIAPGRFLIVEGLFALTWDEARKLMGTKVYVEAPNDVCLQRRIVRDIRERGRTRESVLEQYRATVGPMAELHVYPARALADVVVSGELPLATIAAAVIEHIRSVDPERVPALV